MKIEGKRKDHIHKVLKIISSIAACLISGNFLWRKSWYERDRMLTDRDLNCPICKWLQIVIRKAFNPFQLVMLGIIEKSQLVSYCINLLVLSINHNKIVAVKAMIKKYILSLILLYQIQN